MTHLPDGLPNHGVGEDEAFALLGREIRTRSALLGAADALAHMDPPTPSIASRLVGLSAEFNQNLLHPDLSPFATEVEQRAIQWLLPFFGMQGGHMCAGSTIANLTALWCAREHGAKRVVASEDAHISVPKSARILGLPYETVPVDKRGRMDGAHVPDLSGAALVLTAGTTGCGAVDVLSLAEASHRRGAAWVHVDAAWAGPLRLTRFADRLNGIEHADSVAVSAHKWLFQPKDSALVLFGDARTQAAVSYGGAYIAVPNVGVQGSRGAAGVALLGTLIAWGRKGLAGRIERCVDLADHLAARLDKDRRAVLRQWPETAVLNWRPVDTARTEAVIAALGRTASRTAVNGEPWVRQVAANVHADIDVVWAKVDEALG